MRVELANVVYCGGVGVNALATMCKLIGWLHHHQNTEKPKQKTNWNQNIICEIPPKMHMICGHCVSPAFLLALQKFLLQRQRVCNICLIYGVWAMGFCFIRDQSCSYIFDIYEVISHLSCLFNSQLAIRLKDLTVYLSRSAYFPYELLRFFLFVRCQLGLMDLSQRWVLRGQGRESWRAEKVTDINRPA